MKVSILIVCYNQEHYIKQALEGVLMQNTPFDYEVIVADDFSKDRTLEIIKQLLESRIPNITFLKSETNLGISKNYQRAFNICKGQYIAVLEGDDYWTSPNHLVNHVNFLDNHRECVMSMNRLITYHEDKLSFSQVNWPKNEDYYYVSGQDMAQGNKLGNLSACVFRGTAVSEIDQSLFDLEIADWMLGLYLCQFGFIAKLKESTSVYRVHNKGEWSKFNKEIKKEHLILMIDLYNKKLNFIYDAEFIKYKSKINGNLVSWLSEYKLSDFFPPIFKTILLLLIPKVAKVIFSKFKIKFLNFISQ